MVTSSIVQDPMEPESFEIAPSMVADSTMDAVEVETFETFDSHDFAAPTLATNTSNQIIALAIRNPVIPTDDPNGYANLIGPAPVTMTVLKSADGALGVSVNSNDTGPVGTYIIDATAGGTVVFYGCFLVIGAHGGTWFRTPCPTVVRSRSKC